MDKQTFKSLWESNDSGGGLTFDDVAECAKDWGIYSTPRVHQMDKVLFDVLQAANTNDAHEYKPEEL